MNFVLSSVLGHHTLAYLDDVVVHSRGFSQHLKDLEETLQLLAAAGLKLNIEKKGQSWKWEKDQQQAFEELKRHLASAPDFSQPFELHTDASSITLGAALIQRDHDGALHAIAYYSRKQCNPETCYPAIDCEALVVVEGVRVFDSYAHDLSYYDFEIRYKEGPTNYVPDLLSRQIAAIDVRELSSQNLLWSNARILHFKISHPI
nr:uncharacterized protein LOC113823640 [Penaeus vannamei]